MGKVIVIGSYIEALVMDVPRLPLKGETLHGHNFRQTWGGKGSNQAVQAARLGADTTFVTMVGKDAFAENLKKLMVQEGINTNFIYTHPTLPTASGFIICSAAGENIITIDIAALRSIDKTVLNDIKQHITAPAVVLMQLEIPLEASLYACQIAKEKGAIAVLNPAPAVNLTSLDLSYIDFLTPNETEARVCVGLSPDDPTDELELANRLLQTGCKNVVVTLGERGALWVSSSGASQHIAPFKIEKVVDSTGAGDAFNGGFVTALSEGKSIPEAIRLGNACGALACTVADTIPSYHNLQQIQSFISKF